MAVVLALVLAVPATGQEALVEVMATGLDSPRGLAIGPDGALYVAEAGTAGDTCLTDIPGRGRLCVGASGAVTRIAEGQAERIVEGLPSISSAGEIHGPSDISFVDQERFYIITNLASHPDDRAAMPAGIGDMAGWLLDAATDGVFEPLVDVAAFEATDNPDAEYSGGEVFSNPHSVAALDGGAAVVDAGGNALLKVDEAGGISVLAVLPPLVLEYTPAELAALGEAEETWGSDSPQGEQAAADDELIEVPVQAVPTSVAIGPDGAYYVGQLVGGPYPVGEASVWRIEEGLEPEAYATGLSNIIDLAFGPDGTLYVAEISADSLMDVFEGDSAPTGAIVAIPPGGGEAETIISDRRVVAPGGIAVAQDGSIYVSTGTLAPGGGAVVRIRR